MGCYCVAFLLGATLCRAHSETPEWKKAVISWVFPHMTPLSRDHSVHLVPGSVVATPTEWF
jgi:hypothetical protein